MQQSAYLCKGWMFWKGLFMIVTVTEYLGLLDNWTERTLVQKPMWNKNKNHNTWLLVARELYTNKSSSMKYWQVNYHNITSIIKYIFPLADVYHSQINWKLLLVISIKNADVDVLMIPLKSTSGESI
jgi:hypothetical protein